MIVITLIVLLLLGGTQIPKLMKWIGKGVRSSKKRLTGEVDDDGIKKEKQD